MLEVVVVLTLAGFAGGYLAGYASLWEDIRRRLETFRDGQYDRFLQLYGERVPETRLPERTLKAWFWHLPLGKIAEAMTCPICAGWHAAWITGLAWHLLGDWPLDLGSSFAAWLAACGAHTILMDRFMKSEISP